MVASARWTDPWYSVVGEDCTARKQEIEHCEREIQARELALRLKIADERFHLALREAGRCRSRKRLRTNVATGGRDAEVLRHHVVQRRLGHRRGKGLVDRLDVARLPGIATDIDVRKAEGQNGLATVIEQIVRRRGFDAGHALFRLQVGRAP